jgi:hypothetical protein
MSLRTHFLKQKPQIITEMHLCIVNTNRTGKKYYVFGHYLSSCLYLKTVLFIFQNTMYSETEFCLRLQVKPTQLGPIDRSIPYLRTPVPARRWGT